MTKRNDLWCGNQKKSGARWKSKGRDDVQNPSTAPRTPVFDSLLSSGIRFLMGSTSPWMFIAFMILMAAASIQHTESVPIPAYRVKYEIEIPGLGKAYPQCGRVFKILKCKGCGFKQPVKNSCDRPQCPTCWRGWAAGEVKRCVERIFGFKDAYKRVKGRRLGNPQNMILSPPPEWTKNMLQEEDGIEKIKKAAIKLLKRFGVYGGVLFYHHYRVLDVYKAKLRVLSKKEGKDFWDLIREDPFGLGDWRCYVYVSPHFHVEGYGKKVFGAAVYKQTGWIFKFKRHISNKEELSKTIFYLLSHSAVREGKRAETWFGSLSYNKLGKTKVSVEYEPVLCPECGAELEIEYVLTGLREDAVQKNVSYEYWFRVKKKKPKVLVQDVIGGG